MSAFIPKSQSGAARPWLLKSLDSEKPKTDPQQDAERVAAINRKAYREGHDAGYSAGTRAAAAEAQRLAGLMEGIQGELAGIDQRVSGELVALALALARALVRESLKVHPEQVESVVREAVRTLPLFNQSARLRLNPDDATLLASRLGPELDAHWSVVPDPAITRGGCRVESSAGDVDATMETRWARISAALANDTSWHE
jgi:flagellar assembly protein FliH